MILGDPPSNIHCASLEPHGLAWRLLPLLLFLGLLGHLVHPERRAAAGALPLYTLFAEGAAAARWEPDAIITADQGTLVSLLLRPSQAVTGPVELRAFRGQGGQLRRWAAPFRRSERGTFELRAHLQDLPELSPGRWDIVLLLGRSEALPADPFALPPGPGGAGWQVVPLRLSVCSGSCDRES